MNLLSGLEPIEWFRSGLEPLKVNFVESKSKLSGANCALYVNLAEIVS